MTTFSSQPDKTLRPALSLYQAAVLGVGLLTITLFLTGASGWYAGIESSLDVRSVSHLGASTGAVAAYLVTLGFLVVLAHCIIASFIYWRKRGDWMVVFMSLVLVTNGAVIPFSQMQAGNVANTLWLNLTSVVMYLGLGSSIMLLFVFPEHGFIPRWTAVIALVWALLMAAAFFWPGSGLSLRVMPGWLRVLVLLAAAGLGAYAQVYRYRYVASQVQRQQVKWSLLGLAAAATGPVLYFLWLSAVTSVGDATTSNLLYQRAGAGLFTFSFGVRLASLTLFALLQLILPVTFAIAILRYRLWDIDVILRRTVVYSLLTGALIVVYAVVVIVAQAVFLVVLQTSSTLALVISTLVIAVLFTPLRRRIQEGIDRRFFRQKYDAQQVLAQFAHTARDETDLAALTTELVRVVEETMQPEHVSVWLKPGERGRVV